jgi:hypothetical protein
MKRVFPCWLRRGRISTVTQDVRGRAWHRSPGGSLPWLGRTSATRQEAGRKPEDASTQPDIVDGAAGTCSTPAGTVQIFASDDVAWSALVGVWQICDGAYSIFVGALSDTIGVEFEPPSPNGADDASSRRGNLYFLTRGASGPVREVGFDCEWTYEVYGANCIATRPPLPAMASSSSIHPVRENGSSTMPMRVQGKKACWCLSERGGSGSCPATGARALYNRRAVGRIAGDAQAVRATGYGVTTMASRGPALHVAGSKGAPLSQLR